MTIKSTTLRPGFLVSLKTSVRGGVSYQRRVIESATTNQAGAEHSCWETEKTVIDPAENEAARKVRGGARSLITGACAQSAFGLLCPENNVETLEAAIGEARRLVADFNAAAQLTRIDIYVITGRIAPNDAEAVRAINSEISELMATMQQGIETLDAKTIRDAASRAREVGTMLSPTAEAQVKIAIDVARQTARKIAAAGEGVAQEVDRSAVRKLAEQRTAFLDFSEEVDEIQVPKIESRAVDFPVQE
jgi:hypothetical protein